MSDPRKQPGQGFVPVRGYEPPAGTQAAEIRRREEAEERRRKQENDQRFAESLADANRQRGSKPPEGCLVFLVAGVALGIAAARTVVVMMGA